VRRAQVEPAQCRELVQHQQQLVPAFDTREALGQPPSDLVQDQPHQRLRAADIRGRDDKVEADGMVGLDQVADAPVAARGNQRRNRIPIEPEKRHCRRQHARAFIIALVQKLARGLGHDGVHATLTKVRRGHHQAECTFDRPGRIGEEGCNAGQ
jgi:hypothetical protein